MKILFISSMGGSGWGGSEELWFKTAKQLRAENYEVAAFYYDWFPEPSKIKELRSLNVIIYKHIRKRKSIFQRMIQRISKTSSSNITPYLNLFEFDPDLIIISQGTSFDILYDKPLQDFITKIKKPYFLISQFNYESGNIISEKIKNQSLNIIKLAKIFYFVSERNCDIAERQIASEIKNKKLIDNPINIGIPKILPWPTSGKIKLACVARLECTYKGQDILLESLSKFKDYDFELNFYGKGDDKEHLEALIIYYGLSKKVFMRGHVNDIEEIWATHHLLVLPSICEGTPLSLQECMLCGRPALVTDVGGCDQLIISNQTGFLSPVANKKNLELNLEKVFNSSQEELKQLGINAFEHAKNIINLNSEMVIINDIKNTLN
jgi:glycosyltransferase involved in cell wall biosynthesis